MHTIRPFRHVALHARIALIPALRAMVQRMLDRSPEFAQKLRHGWLHLCSHDPLLQRWQDWS